MLLITCSYLERSVQLEEHSSSETTQIPIRFFPFHHAFWFHWISCYRRNLIWCGILNWLALRLNLRVVVVWFQVQGNGGPNPNESPRKSGFLSFPVLAEPLLSFASSNFLPLGNVMLFSFMQSDLILSYVSKVFHRSKNMQLSYLVMLFIFLFSQH